MSSYMNQLPGSQSSRLTRNTKDYQIRLPSSRIWHRQPTEPNMATSSKYLVERGQQNLTKSENIAKVNSNGLSFPFAVSSSPVKIPSKMPTALLRGGREVFKEKRTEEVEKYFCYEEVLQNHSPLNRRYRLLMEEFLQMSMEHLKVLRFDRLQELVVSKKKLLKDQKKPILLMDLDETLVHCCNGEDEARCQYEVQYKNLDDVPVVLKLNVRPHLQYFLSTVSKHYSINIYTASQERYSAAVVQLIDPQQQFIEGVFHRAYCSVTVGGMLVKDIRSVVHAEHLQNAFLVDNSPKSFAPQINNGIPILPFTYDTKDCELLKLAAFLEQLHVQKNKTDFLKNHFKLSKFVKYASLKDLKEFLCSSPS